MQRTLILRLAMGLGLLVAAALLLLAPSPESAAHPLTDRVVGSDPGPAVPLDCTLTWSVVPHAGSARFSDVSASGPNDVWAVGTNLTTAAAIVEHWDGTAWTISATPPISGTPNAVVALAPNDVWVGGSLYITTPSLTYVALHWNGSAWTTTPWGSFGSAITISDMSAVSTNDVWAVNPASDDGTYAHHWNGTTWTTYFPLAEARQPEGGVAFDLYGISARATNDVWAVGSSICGSCSGAMLSHWNGTTWSTDNTHNSSYSSVLALASNNVWAVGGIGILHYNGGTWTPVAAPVGGFNSIAGSGPTDMWAVSRVATTTSLVHWTGASWTVAYTTSIPLSDVAVAGPNDIWAVGDSILHYVSQPSFSDVPTTNTFYNYIQWMSCHSYISGYPCGGAGEPCVLPGNLPYFRPGNNVTRGQLSKIITAAAGWVDPVSGQTFEDVPPGSTFYDFVERAYSHGIISGYPCGSPGEPCVAPTNRPYFRPNASTTRGQIAKIVSLARAYTETPTAQTFEDVPPGSTFYLYIERLSSRGIIAGYPCGGPGEACVPPGNRAYFRPNNVTTRGQLSKIITVAYTVP